MAVNAGADPLDIALASIVGIRSRWADGHRRSRILAGAWHRVYVLARGRGDQELAAVARDQVHYYRGRRAADAGERPDIGASIVTAISRARANPGESNKGSMGGSG